MITVGSQRDLFQGLSIHWVIFCSRKSFSDRSSTPAFPPTIARWILPVKAVVKLSMSKRKTIYFGFALGVLRLSVLCLFSSARLHSSVWAEVRSVLAQEGFGTGLALGF